MTLTANLPDFDELIDRRGTHSAKWDKMEALYGVSPADGLPMWVADMDVRPPACVTKAVQDMLDVGIYGYFGDDRAYLEAITWWHRTRNNWEVDPSWIFTTHGLVNGTALCIEAFTAPGDGVVLFTPVYHAFFRVIEASGREVVQCPLVNRDGRYEMDFDAYDAMMTGSEKMLVLCSPHNPGGRVWTQEELTALAAFAKRHDLILVSDEIHHDLVYKGETFVPMDVAAPGFRSRTVTLTAPSKTFNIAGQRTGNMIIPDPDLRNAMTRRLYTLDYTPSMLGVEMIRAAYSPEGAAWVDTQMAHLDKNRRLMDDGLNAIPGIRSMPLQSTYLAWVDFTGTGMTHDEVLLTAELIREINKTASLIVVEHDMQFIRMIADKVTVFHRGAILIEDTMDVVAADPTVREVYLGHRNK